MGRKPSGSQKAMLAIVEQLVWIETHGATLAGYIKNYGAEKYPDHFGDGGEAIYDADVAELHRLYQEYRFAIS